MPKEIVAYINTKWIITIHKRDCKIIIWVDRDRLLSAYIKWIKQEFILFHITLVFKNNLGILKELSETLFSMKIEVDEIKSEKIWNYKIVISLKLLVSDYEYLMIDRFIDRLKINFSEDLIEYNIEKIKKNRKNKIKKLPLAHSSLSPSIEGD